MTLGAPKLGKEDTPESQQSPVGLPLAVAAATTAAMLIDGGRQVVAQALRTPEVEGTTPSRYGHPAERFATDRRHPKPPKEILPGGEVTKNVTSRAAVKKTP